MVMNQMIDGLLVINKPKGMTSFDIVAKVRRLVGQKKVGHAGTLDPNVDGVLVVALGKATKLIDELQTRPKSYIGEITLGFATETEDLDGQVIEELSIDIPFSSEKIDNAIQQLNGPIKQKPPMYSAVKVNGKRLYEYARNGEIVERPIREAMIHSFRRTSNILFANGLQKFDFEAKVSKGTYIRTLAVDTGQAIGIPATMTKLTRVMGSGFKIEESLHLDELMRLEHNDVVAKVIPIKEVLDWPIKELNEDEWFAVKNGQKISNWSPSNQYLQLYYQNKLKAVYQYDEDGRVWRSRYVFDNQ
ncbi:tRNA pseudouridine synthase B [Leuconostoc litchii]|uniref:tRNA pseudouridine synthase B n=1 Tax=Leuconostoc litchii TaxID=1981069 RepID=A0A6P2CMC9_9LACO|nr:tRNA pseudouridine(55) synthase TruB [Leuconostoc litchii]TYC46734.1 tRNA pseudouridine(55) synthase TruB [Leuconostoc litchii]GMA70615.1 tRNA pseudouridine synthase B [Leuconostoc litchii]